MSGTLGIALALLTLGSCWASYQIGKRQGESRKNLPPQDPDEATLIGEITLPPL